jgi:hypothetical protein
MKTHLIAALAVVAASLLRTSPADAQVVVEPGPLGRTYAVGGGLYPGSSATVVLNPDFHIPPYSYWAAYPFPARGYVGYGTNDFPFYGTAYGSPSDPWTWPAMSRYPWTVAHYGALPPW